MSAEIIAWLRSPEGEEWSRRRSDAGPMGGATAMRRDGPVDPAEDPTGRPHPRLGAAKDAATGEVA